MKPLIVGTWKMNPTSLAEAKQLFNSVKEGVKDINDVETVICAPFVYLPILETQDSSLVLGAQDCFWEEKGAFTGEISPKMLKDLGCKYVIIGHSERRKHQQETDEMINKKIKAVLNSGLSPIVCIGDRKKDSAEDVKEISTQLEKDLAGLESFDLSNLIIMYEPVWAISTTKGGRVATAKDAIEGVNYIKKELDRLFGKDLSQKTKFLYGGSVNSENIKDFIFEAKLDGVLVGGASLKDQEFINTVKGASKS